jgi:hypothetical protein
MLLASRLKQFNASRHQSRLIEAVSSGFMPSGAPKMENGSISRISQRSRSCSCIDATLGTRSNL